jgi:hypothetical protein
MSVTITEFCRAEKISKAAYYTLRKRGLGPDELVIVGTRIKRITEEAHAAWRTRMAELAKSETAQLEAERRSLQTSQAGKLAAASPLHACRRKQAPKRKRR